MFGEHIPVPRALYADDSPYADYMIEHGYPTACPTCGSRTRPAMDIPEGWLCSHPACDFSVPSR